MGFFSNLFHHDDIQGTKKYIYITGMVCQNCSKHVTLPLKPSTALRARSRA